MDTWTQGHLRRWLEHEFTDNIVLKVFKPMVAKFDEDPEFWGNQSYWKLYDAVREGV